MQREPDCDYAVQLVAERFNLGRPDAQKAFREFVGRMNQAYFPPITKMELIHTEGCNLACDYCFEKNMIGYRRMKPEVGEAAIDLLLEYSQGEPELTITHFGGEPMVNFPAVRRMTEYAERRAAETDKRIHFSMTSNGVLFNRSRARYCADHGIMVLLSVDGLKDSHDRFRRDRKGRGTFDAVMRGMSYLKETQRWIGVKLTVMPHNARSLLAERRRPARTRGEPVRYRIRDWDPVVRR